MSSNLHHQVMTAKIPTSSTLSARLPAEQIESICLNNRMLNRHGSIASDSTGRAGVLFLENRLSKPTFSSPPGGSLNKNKIPLSNAQIDWWLCIWVDVWKCVCVCSACVAIQLMQQDQQFISIKYINFNQSLCHVTVFIVCWKGRQD